MQRDNPVRKMGKDEVPGIAGYLRRNWAWVGVVLILLILDHIALVVLGVICAILIKFAQGKLRATKESNRNSKGQIPERDHAARRPATYDELSTAIGEVTSTDNLLKRATWYVKQHGSLSEENKQLKRQLLDAQSADQFGEHSH